MGLSIHYTLSARQPLTDADVRKLVLQARDFAIKTAAEEVSPLIEVESDFPLAQEWIPLHPASEDEPTHLNVPPDYGWIFTAFPGEGCESVLLGLCRYPATVRYEGRDLPVKGGTGWRLQHACKTQFSSLRGWETFRRCHLLVLELLNFWRTLGISVRIQDEGGYWPRRSEKVLREKLKEMNGIVAAMSGALRDDPRGLSVVSPIFENPQFEQLEARGAEKHRDKLRQAIQTVAKVARKK